MAVRVVEGVRDKPIQLAKCVMSADITILDTEPGHSNTAGEIAFEQFQYFLGDDEVTRAVFVDALTGKKRINLSSKDIQTQKEGSDSERIYRYVRTKSFLVMSESVHRNLVEKQRAARAALFESLILTPQH